MIYLDVTKAYDKAWLDALLYVLNKRGIETENWQITNDINTNLTATIKTKYGNTRETRRHSVEHIHSPCHKFPLFP